MLRAGSPRWPGRTGLGHRSGPCDDEDDACRISPRNLEDTLSLLLEFSHMIEYGIPIRQFILGQNFVAVAVADNSELGRYPGVATFSTPFTFTYCMK